MGVGWYSDDAGRRERLLSDALPILAHEFLANGCTLIIVNQMRNRQGVMYGSLSIMGAEVACAWNSIIFALDMAKKRVRKPFFS